MLILPAIDLRGGQCVRLRQGDYAQETVFGADPAAMARRWVEQGAPWLHLVDLDGAREGRPVNGDSVQAHRPGGRRSLPARRRPAHRGPHRRGPRLGRRRASSSARGALRDPDWCRGAVPALPRPGRRSASTPSDGRVATEGWLEVSDHSALDLARQCAGWPLAAHRLHRHQPRRHARRAERGGDGRAGRRRADVPVIASGGVTTLDDVGRLARRGLAGCIIGRALYEGRIDLAAAVALAKRPTSPKPSEGFARPSLARRTGRRLERDFSPNT